ncbi:MAG: hypothetical protein ACKOSS_10510 [Planctomycetia bacterium]
MPRLQAAPLPSLLLALPLALLLLVSRAPRPAWAGEIGRHRLGAGGVVKVVRAIDLDGDGRKDLVLLLEGQQGRSSEVLLLRTPATPDAAAYFPGELRTRLPCEGELAGAGALAVGRFGPGGEVRLRFLGPTGVVELGPDGTRLPARAGLDTPTLLVRSPGRALAFWDGVADLDGDGRDELWLPAADAAGGVLVLHGGGAAGEPVRRTRLAVRVGHAAGTSLEQVVQRTTYVPTLVAADLDGDRRKELVELRERVLRAYDVLAPEAGDAAGATAREPARSIALRFLEPPADLAPEEVRSPRLNLADADGDGTTDLLVTLVTGRRDKIGGMRTTLWYLPGPIADASGTLRQPEGRIDTESVALHPTFVDLDGDGGLDYACDAIRGSAADLVRNVMGKDPTITLVGFRLDRQARRYVPEPFFTAARTYPAQQALSNKFGSSTFLGGDLDGDGLKDLLDLGTLSGVEVLKGERRPAGEPGEPLRYSTPLLARVALPRAVAPAALLEDLDGDGRSEAVLWGEDELFVLAPRGPR